MRPLQGEVLIMRKLKLGQRVDLWANGSVTVTEPGQYPVTYKQGSAEAKRLWACASPLTPDRGGKNDRAEKQTFVIIKVDSEERSVTVGRKDP